MIFLNEEINKISNFEIVKKEQLYDWIVVPVFDTKTSEQKRIEAGVIAEATDAEAIFDDSLAAAADEVENTEASIEEEDENEIDEDENKSYLETSFKGTNLIMAILFVTLTIVVFILLIILLWTCR